MRSPATWFALIVAIAMMACARGAAPAATPTASTVAVTGAPSSFDHARTGWPLAGVHATTPCTRCHGARDPRGDVVYTGVEPACEGCHAAQQPHQLRRAMACDRCHDDRGWRPAHPGAFDHDEAAMPLIGAHRAIPCVTCHPGQRYGRFPAQPDACDQAGCHVNVHGSQLFGQRNCVVCHAPSSPSMKQISFDHAARLPIGKHATLACAACHTAERGAGAADVTCERCHASSPHGERFAALGKPAPCATCHSLGRWSSLVFQHAVPLAPRALHGHRSLTCRGCHRGTRPDEFEDLRGQAGCKDCHAHRNAHVDVDHPEGKFTTNQCLNCHFMSSEPWAPRQMFLAVHGQNGTFRLDRGHARAACADCHTATSSQGKPIYSGLSPECGPACHGDDLHRGNLGPTCTGCHVPQTWEAFRFDHDQPFPAGARVAQFPLRGVHRALACEACHPRRDFAAAGTACSSAGCHAADDAHAGQLGAACARCHTETGRNRFDHARSSFPLEGKHRDVACRGCHASARFASAPRRCAGCHPVPAFHRDTGISPDADCSRCHTPRGW